MVLPSDSCGCLGVHEEARLFLEAIVEKLESDWSWREADMIELLRRTEAL